MIYFLREEDMAKSPHCSWVPALNGHPNGGFYKVASRVGSGWLHCLIDVCGDPHFPVVDQKNCFEVLCVFLAVQVLWVAIVGHDIWGLRSGRRSLLTASCSSHQNRPIQDRPSPRTYIKGLIECLKLCYSNPAVWGCSAHGPLRHQPAAPASLREKGRRPPRTHVCDFSKRKGEEG